MKRNYLFSLGLIFLALSSSAQVRKVTEAQAAAASVSNSPATQTTPPSADAARRIAMRARHVAQKQTPTGPRAAIVVLSAPSVIEQLVATAPDRRGDGTVENTAAIHERMLGTEGQTHAQTLRASKAPLVAQLQARGVEVMSQTEHVLNAIMISATEADLVWLRSQPGVKSAEFSAVRRVMLNAATTLVGAPAVWSQLGGAPNAGKGIKIAVMGTGIDITHPMFSASGFTAPSGFPVSSGGQGGTYTNSKVIVARNYICASSTVRTTCPNSSTSPDGTSYDHNGGDGFGHDTGTAAAAAGECVSTPLGATICGIAPGAYLGNYKVCDSQGSCSDAAFLSAMNDAMTDKMDVISYSVGSPLPANPCGSMELEAGCELPTHSTDYLAIHNAVTAGVPVVIAAGNCGPYEECGPSGDNSITDPANVPEAISVGATSNSHVIGNAVTVTASVAVPASLQSIASSPPFNEDATDQAQLYQVSSFGPATLVDVFAINSTGVGCSPLPAGSLTGKIALMRYSFDLPCDPTQPDVTSTNNAQAAGAIGVIYVDNIEEEILGPYNYLLGGNIPSTLITYASGTALQALVDANPGSVQASFNGNPGLVPQTADQVADYSSRGPQNDFTIKPELVAPGDIYTASACCVDMSSGDEIYDPSGYNYTAGTSYATPIVAGAAAILRQKYPSSTGITPNDIKSMLANTGAPVTSAQDGGTISVQMYGGGRLNLPAAMATTLVSNPVSFSFGQVPSPAAGYTQSQQVTLKGVGSSSETFKVTVNQAVSGAGLTVTANPTTVSVSAGGTASLSLSMNLSGVLYGIYEGTVVLTSTSTATTIHLPYWMMLGNPTFPSNGLVDGAGFGKTVTPGDIASLFGTALGSSTGVGAAILRLPFELNHTVVSVYGNSSVYGIAEFPTNLFYSSNSQVNFQMPSDFIVGQRPSPTLQVYLQGIEAINTDGNPTTITVPTPATSPGIFFNPSGSTSIAIVTHQSGALVTASNPAALNEIVTIYCAGLGATNPFIFGGDPGPIPPATTNATPTVTIGGATQSVSFSGLTPLFAGLYQINATIGGSTPAGAQTISISIGGATSNSATTYIQ